ncbi:hypothetical protein, partial [Nonomuraea pusilla]
AEKALTEWAANNARRDELVRAARTAGVSKNRIHVLTGIARTTIDRIFQERSMNVQDLATAVKTTLGDHPENFDVDGIIAEIGTTYGYDLKSIDDIPSDEYWQIVERHDTTLKA